MDRPFRELHEYYRIVYERAEAHAKAEKERAEQEEKQREEEENAERRKKGLPPLTRREQPSDASLLPNSKQGQIHMSSLEAEMYEDTLEELVEGGAV